MNEPQERLWTLPFVNICASNFAMFFSFYLLLPVLPIYIHDVFHTTGALAGIILASYSLAALICRPFAGYLVDTFSRKPIYLAAYIVFGGLFFGYYAVTTITLVAMIRFLHGMSFGIVTTSGNTIAVDILPSRRRGEGIGYFGVTTNLAFATGPMAGVFILEKFNYEAVFISSFCISLVGILLVFLLRVKAKIPETKAAPISLDRFFLVAAFPQFLIFMFMAFAFGVVTNYIGLYGKTIGISQGAGYFYALIALGLITVRLLTGRFVDRGYLTRFILIGTVLLSVTYFLLSVIPVPPVYFASAFIIGAGYGLICPSAQTLFVNMANNNQRGTASGTYLSSWDTGTGAGILFGGPIAEMFGYSHIFLVSSVLLMAGFFLFLCIGKPHYEKNKLR